MLTPDACTLVGIVWYRPTSTCFFSKLFGPSSLVMSGATELWTGKISWKARREVSRDMLGGLFRVYRHHIVPGARMTTNISTQSLQATQRCAYCENIYCARIHCGQAVWPSLNPT
jgi:hypothetical protein